MSAYSSRSPGTKPKRRRLTHAQRFLRFLVFLGSLGTALLIAFHNRIPDVAGIGLVLDNAAPWLGLAVPALLLLAVASRSRTSLAFLLVPAFTWLFAFTPSIVPLAWTAPDQSAQTLTFASQNIKAGTGGAEDSALALSAHQSDVIALQELDAGSAQRVTDALATMYPHHFVVGTVGVWSKYPLRDSRSLDLGLGWKRALSTRVATGHGDIRLYAIHAASARPNDHVDRDEMLNQLATVVRADPHENIVAIGDFNATSTDRAFEGISAVLDEPNQDEGLFGFTWPQKPFPMMRLDHVLVRGLGVVSNTDLPAGRSDHLAIKTTVNLPGQ
ncbi:endonuclease/exonuclease/phosphatase family protein [Paeniglutamicibacter antarcticus]|uniref:Endonuclease/exonuclease/phosphatase family protein n=1 Tax=Paeniglutamicibacter antarcticus TaxID=494023 RepID=A0ABP9TJP8_9MICC